MDPATDVFPCEESGRANHVQSFVHRPDHAENVTKGPGSGAYTPRNKLVRQSSQDHEQIEEKLQHSDSGKGKSLGLGESQDEEQPPRAVHRSLSQPASKTQSGEMPGKLIHSDSGQGQYLALGENQDEDDPPHLVRRSISHPGPNNASNKAYSDGKLTHSDSGQGKSLALGESQEEENPCCPVNRSNSYSGSVSNRFPGEGSSLAVLSPHHSFSRQSSNRTENIDSGIEKTPSIDKSHFPFGSENLSHSYNVLSDQCSAKIPVIADETPMPKGIHDQVKQDFEGPVFGYTDQSCFGTNGCSSFSNLSSCNLTHLMDETSIPSAAYSHVTSYHQSGVPSYPMVSRSTFDQLTRELSRTRDDKDMLMKDIETLKKTLEILKRELDESKRKFDSLVNSEDKRKRELGQEIYNLRTKLQQETDTSNQLSMKIAELNSSLNDKNKHIEHIEKENNALKTRNDFLEEEVEKLWKKEGERQNGDAHQVDVRGFSLRSTFPNESSSADDTIPKVPIPSQNCPNLNIHFRQKEMK